MKQIRKSKLVKNRWYVGRGRNGNVGFWDGTDFLVIGEKFGDWVIKREPYFGPKSGCFQPFRVIDEGVVTKKHEVSGYAREMVFEEKRQS